MHDANVSYKIASTNYEESTILDGQLLEKSCIVFSGECSLALDTKPALKYSRTALRVPSVRFIIELVVICKIFSCKQMDTHTTLQSIK